MFKLTGEEREVQEKEERGKREGGCAGEEGEEGVERNWGRVPHLPNLDGIMATYW